jgi:GntR family transcriptional regulator
MRQTRRVMTEPRKQPKWRQIHAKLREKIKDGTYPPGTTLPQIKAYADEVGAHKETVRAAYKALEADGLVRSIQRKGSVVIEPQPRRRITRGVSVTRDPKRGYVFPAASRPDEPWELHGKPFRKELPAPAEVTELFDLEAKTKVLRRRRVTSPAGEPPFQLVDTWISPAAVEAAPRVADPSPGPGGYLDRLEEEFGPLEWDEAIRARLPAREEAKLLRIAETVPVMETVIVGTPEGSTTPVEVTIRVIPSDRVELVARLQRRGRAVWPVAPVEQQP